ncbi:MAG: methyltransferase domain-containing protein, partial [Planctomycetota bacterium]
MKKHKNQFCTSLSFILVILATSSFITAQPLAPKQQARQILKACNVKGGLIVHIGCGNGRLTAALRANDGYLVHGLDRSDSRVARA